ncbi:hypothetical protein VTN00DRAFT_9705 [Thermoascus crustaceus]|uniref:uncharacterized protein n=1 Tax=Thermoascus crustaceus TaxID=5088 RepID=UPI003742EC44
MVEGDVVFARLAFWLAEPGAASCPACITPCCSELLTPRPHRPPFFSAYGAQHSRVHFIPNSPTFIVSVESVPGCDSSLAAYSSHRRFTALHHVSQVPRDAACNLRTRRQVCMRPMSMSRVSPDGGFREGTSHLREIPDWRRPRILVTPGDRHAQGPSDWPRLSIWSVEGSPGARLVQCACLISP